MRRIALVRYKVVESIIEWDGTGAPCSAEYDAYDVTLRPEVQVGWVRTMTGLEAPSN